MHTHCEPFSPACDPSAVRESEAVKQVHHVSQLCNWQRKVCELVPTRQGMRSQLRHPSEAGDVEITDTICLIVFASCGARLNEGES
jgi:hypothetical protein